MEWQSKQKLPRHLHPTGLVVPSRDKDTVIRYMREFFSNPTRQSIEEALQILQLYYKPKARLILNILYDDSDGPDKSEYRDAIQQMIKVTQSDLQDSRRKLSAAPTGELNNPALPEARERLTKAYKAMGRLDSIADAIERVFKKGAGGSADG